MLNNEQEDRLKEKQLEIFFILSLNCEFIDVIVGP